MKSFRSLTQRIRQLRQRNLSSENFAEPTPFNHLTINQLTISQLLKRLVKQALHYGEKAQSYLHRDFLASALRPNPHRRKMRPNERVRSRVLLLIAILSLTSAIGYQLYNEPQLDVGTIAPQTLRATASVRVVDTKTTDANRKAARVAAIPVLALDQGVNQDIYRSLQRTLDRGNELRQTAGPFPFLETSVLSTTTQRFLRKAEEWDWRSATAAVEEAASISMKQPTASATSAQTPPKAANPSLQIAIIELQNYRRVSSLEDFSVLREAVNRARRRYDSAVANLLADPVNKADALYDASLLNLTDDEWVNMQTSTRTVLERILRQGVAAGLPKSLLKGAVKAQMEEIMPPDTANLAVRILMGVLRPNLVQDPEQTKRLAEQAAQAVQDVVVEIRQGEVIVEAGQPITQENFVLLDYFHMSRRRINGVGLLGFGSLVSGAVWIFLWVERRFHPGLRHRDHLLVLLLTLSAPLAMALNVPVINLPAVGLLVGSFYGSALGGITVLLLSIILPIGMEVSWTSFIASTVGGLLGAVIAGRSRSREELAILGVFIGITQGAVYLVLTLMLSTTSTPVWYIVLTTTALQSLMAIAWSVVALGISPYLEHLFDLITPMRLAELSSPNRPLLKRLAAEAPGTFQHTLFVATLAEAAARALGCNVELVRTGTLYHDIGKMHDPQGFIENQMGGVNKHDEIDNPWESTALIKKHVSEGIVMARKYRLPKAIEAFIPEHQGTMSIAYFHHQAQQLAQADPTIVLDEAYFRYKGPIPQSRETAIVMLADSCEAALRTLKDASSEDALAMVNRILRARWQDDQLVDSGLSRADMTRIAEIFVQVWLQFNHQRIPYPKAMLPAPAAPSS
ncbi:MAG: HDIG domain-containing protein [Oscillatoriophycideae cyanobacterium NC_groundwater_1537_Pr4_S-0.65um_50_18]|nr:HDIG domain-containing protein [Oscillatoriophycideae cyanobacterium NC_groundwater_1537_Pr4_S-0.65um_50_18]